MPAPAPFTPVGTGYSEGQLVNGTPTAIWGKPHGSHYYAPIEGKSRATNLFGTSQHANVYIYDNGVMQDGYNLPGPAKYYKTRAGSATLRIRGGYPDYGWESYAASWTENRYYDSQGEFIVDYNVSGDQIAVGSGDPVSATRKENHYDGVNLESHGSETLSGEVTLAMAAGVSDLVLSTPANELNDYAARYASKGEYNVTRACIAALSGFDISDTATTNYFPWNTPFHAEVTITTHRNNPVMVGYYSQGAFDILTGWGIPGERKTYLSDPIPVTSFRDDGGVFDSTTALDDLSWQEPTDNKEAVISLLSTYQIPPVIPPAVPTGFLNRLGFFKSLTGIRYRIMLEVVVFDENYVQTSINYQQLTIDNEGVEVGWITAPGAGQVGWYDTVDVLVSLVEVEDTEGIWQIMSLPEVYGDAGDQAPGVTFWNDAFVGGYKDSPEYAPEKLAAVADWNGWTSYSGGARVKHSGTIYVAYVNIDPGGEAPPGIDWYAVPKRLYEGPLIGNDPKVHKLAFLTKQRTGSRWGFRGFYHNGQQSNAWYRKKTYQANLSL